MSSILPDSEAFPNEASPPHVASSRPKLERRLGLFQVYPDDSDVSATKATTIDIIAIHGLETNGQITWEHNNNNSGKPVHWLRDKHMLPDRIPKARIMTYDWNAQYQKGVSTMTLHAEAIRLIKAIHNERSIKKKTTCPILFIASCFGGLLLVKALVHATLRSDPGDGGYEALLNSTRGIVFLGTPFRGSWKFGTEYIGEITSWAKEKRLDYSHELPQYLKQTTTDLPSPLNDLVRDFESIVKKRGSSLRVACFSESQKSKELPRLHHRPDVFQIPDKDRDGSEIADDNWVKKIIAQDNSEIIVDEDSASIEGAERIGLNLRHNMMNKFNDPKGNEYQLVVGELKRFAELALSAKTKPIGERGSHKNDSEFSGLKDCLYDMPELCYPYQSQSAMHDVLTKFCDSNESGPKKLVLSGFTGLGKTQSCIAFMQFMQEQLKQDIGEKGRLRLLWVAGHSPNAMFESLKNLHECLINGKQQPTFNTSRPAQGAEGVAEDVSRWLSIQSTPWLMVIDHIDDYLELDRKRGDGLGLKDRIKMLESLCRAKNGKIIATASQYPTSVVKSHWQKYTVEPMDKTAALGLVRRYLSGNDSPPNFPDEKAATRLCKILDFLPCCIAIACSTIQARKITVDTYTRNWEEVFDGIPKTHQQRSLDASFLLCLQALKDRSQPAKDLLNILVCLNTPSILEEIFQRAWQSTKLSDGQNSAVSTSPQTYSYKAFQAISNLLGLASKTNDHHTRYSALDFMIPKPDETLWRDSSAKRHLRDTLHILEEASFLRFSQTETNCVITVRPIVQTWMRRSYISGLLLKVDDNHDMYNAWWQASSIVSASLKPISTMEDRGSKSFFAFQKHVAAQIDQLAYLKDNPGFQKISGDNSGSVSSWTTNDLFFNQRGDKYIHIADALDLQGYPLLALEIRDALKQSDSSKAYSIEQLAKLTTHADSLTQNGRHGEALEERRAVLESLQTLYIPTSPKGTSVIAHLHIQKLYKLIIQNDIAESYWNLSRKQEALEMYNTVREGFEKTIANFEQNTDDGITRVRDAVSEPLNQARLGYAECLVYYCQKYDEAEDILSMILKVPRPHDNMQSSHTYLRARSLVANIMFIRGYHRNARIERQKIWQEWRSEDTEMKQLDTMKAQIDYANSLIALNNGVASMESLRLIKEIITRLSKSDRYMSTEFLNHTKQDLARCYMEIANNDFDTRERKYRAQAYSTVHKAATLVQEVWKGLQGRDGRGQIHPETLKSLALMIKYEHYTEICIGNRPLPEMMYPQAFEETKIKITALGKQSDDIKRAWLYVQLEYCLVKTQTNKIRRLESLLHQLPEETSATSKDLFSKVFHLEVRYQIAMAQMEPLRYCKNKREQYQMKKEQKFADAAKDLTEVWKQRRAIRGLGNYETVISLESALMATETVNNNDCIILQAWWCATCAEFYKHDLNFLKKEEEKLHRLQNQRGIKPPKLWSVILEEAGEWVNR